MIHAIQPLVVRCLAAYQFGGGRNLLLRLGRHVLEVEEIVLLDQFLLHNGIVRLLRRFWQWCLEEAMQPKEVREFDYKVACVLFDGQACLLVFVLL